MDNNIDEYEKNSMDTEIFELKNVKDYLCTICVKVPYPDNCVEVACCGHLFCKDCIKQWIETQNICPLCKKTLQNNENDISEIKNKSKFLYRQMCSLIVNCPYKCGEKITLGDLEKHKLKCKKIKQNCKFHSIGCSFTEFGDKVKNHEESNDKLHLYMAMKFIEENKLNNKKILAFDEGDRIKVDCHPHELIFMTRGDYFFYRCDGRKLPGGCPYSNQNEPDGHHFSNNVQRYSCDNCDYDLCNYCAIRHCII